MARSRKTPGLAATSAEGIPLNIKLPKYTLTPRLTRLARALLNHPAGLTREECDRVTPASNSPEYVRQLREKLLLDLPCERIPFVTIDGENSTRGLYRLTNADRAKLALVIQ